MIISREDRIKLTEKLGLINAIDSQDWELEVADQSRVEEFIKLARDDDTLTFEMRKALISLCVSSYNDALAGSDRNPSVEVQLKQLLMSDMSLLYEICQYWDVEGSEEDAYSISSFLREISAH